jgi:hypothetical protein
MSIWKNKSAEDGQPICPVCGIRVMVPAGSLERWELPTDVVIDRGFWLHPECRDSEAAS